MENEKLPFTLLPEENFSQQMEQIILPELAKYRKDFVIERKKGQKISCSKYVLPDAKRIVVISHGFTESKEKYSEVIYYFLQLGCSVWILDHCGHGQSYRLNRDPSLVHVDTFQRYILDFLALSRKAKFEQPTLPMVVYAHSMGGAVAVMSAEQEPDLYDGLILTSPMIRAKTGAIPYIMARELADTECTLRHNKQYVVGHEPYHDEKFEEAVSTSKPRFEYYQNLRRSKRHLQTFAASYGWFKAAALAEDYMFAHADQIRIPVLLLQCYQDSVVNNSRQMDFLEALDKAPEIYLAIIKNSKHEMYSSTNDVLEKYWEAMVPFISAFTGPAN